MKIVMTAGCFDILHPGHIHYLKEAKSIGGEDSILIVVVARDSTVKRIKGKEPIFDEETRRFMVEQLKPVDKAVLGYEGKDLTRIVFDIKPDIIVLGYDQKIDENELADKLKRNGLSSKIFRASKYSGRFKSSSEIINCIIKKTLGEHNG
ncbi:MAG TPA: FAD synthase [Candidatus Bathyarchaeota archaeon]|nr:FAD synthase [Candidatus Bathyarchaeota archaeon]